MTSAFSWQNAISLCPASFCIPRPNLPVTPKEPSLYIRLIIFFSAKDGEALYSQQKEDQELTVTQIMNSLLSNSDLKRVGKTTRPFRYDLNQIPYEYTVEVTNRFKGLDRVLEEL